MSIPLTINGATFEYPENFDEAWGVQATGWAQAVTNGMLQRQGGNFPLLADVNFGTNFGLVAEYYKSETANLATVGAIRLAVSDTIDWRNNANNANLPLGIDGSDNLTFNGNSLSFTGAVNAGSTGQLTYYAATGNAVSPAPFLTYSAPNLILQPPVPGSIVFQINAPGSSSSADLIIEANGLSNAVFTDNNGNFQLRDIDNNRTILEYTRGSSQNSMGIPLDMGSNKITSLPAPSASGDAVAYGFGFDVGSNKITSVANGTNPGDAVNFSQIAAILLPTGTILDFAIGTSTPAGFLTCDGSAVSRTTYANLFSVIGIVWGPGDGSTTFNLPNLSRRVTMGSGGSGSGVIGNIVGDLGGDESVTSTQNSHTHDMANHTHLFDYQIESNRQNDGAFDIGSPDSDGAIIGGSNAGSLNYRQIKNITQTPSTNTTGATTATNNAASVIQPAAIVQKIIKY